MWILQLLFLFSSQILVLEPVFTHDSTVQCTYLHSGSRFSLLGTFISTCPSKLNVFPSQIFPSSVSLASMSVSAQVRNLRVFPESPFAFLPSHNHLMLESCPDTTLHILLSVLFLLLPCHVLGSPSLD